MTTLKSTHFGDELKPTVGLPCVEIFGESEWPCVVTSVSENKKSFWIESVNEKGKRNGARILKVRASRANHNKGRWVHHDHSPITLLESN